MTTTAALTAIQAQAMECLEEARAAGVTLSTHVRSRGLNLRGIYDAIAQLRRRGIVAPASPRMKKRAAAAPLRFARVALRPAVVVPALRLRLTLRNGRGVELEIEDPQQLSRIIAALEAVA